MSTLREHLEAILTDGDLPDYDAIEQHAVAALRILDEARLCCCTIIDAPEGWSRVVPDPEPDA